MAGRGEILEGKRVVRYGPSSAREPVERRPLRNSAENVVFRSLAKFFHDVCESVFFLLSSSLRQTRNDRRILEKIFRSLPFLRFCQILDEKFAQVMRKKREILGGGR